MKKLWTKYHCSKVASRFDPVIMVALIMFLGIQILILPTISGKQLATDRINDSFQVINIKSRSVGDYQIELVSEEVGGSVVIWFKDYPFPFQSGDVVSANCELEPLQGNEGWEKAWLAKGIMATGNCSDWEKTGAVGGLEGIRLKLEKGLVGSVEKYLKPPMSSLLLGMLAGNDAGMPASFADDMRKIGLTHIIVVSGYNITVIFEGARKLLKTIGRIPADLVAAVLLSSFVWIVGAEPPVLRAAVMAWIRVIARCSGRGITSMRALFLSTIVLFLVFPRWTQSVSFHLSFLATFAIFVSDVFVPRFVEKLGIVGGFLKEYLFQTLSVLLFTMPYSAAIFGEISGVSLLSNLAILPVVEDIMALGTIGILGSFVSEKLGKILFGLAWAPLWYLVRATDFLAGISRVRKVCLSLLGSVTVYGLLLLFVFVLKCKKAEE